MFRLLYIVIYFLFTAVLASRQCNTSDLVKQVCSPTETCKAHTNDSPTGYCDCLKGHERINETECEPLATFKSVSQPSSSSLVDDNNSHLAAAITIPIFIIIIVMGGVYFSHKYKLLAWARSKINQRNSNYDEVMIGQDLDDDDPPLS